MIGGNPTFNGVASISARVRLPIDAVGPVSSDTGLGYMDFKAGVTADDSNPIRWEHKPDGSHTPRMPRPIRPVRFAASPPAHAAPATLNAGETARSDHGPTW
jgi:hypothetical protein